MKKLIIALLLVISLTGCFINKEALLKDNMKHAEYAVNYFYAANKEICPKNDQDMLNVMIEIPQDIDNPYLPLEKVVIFGKEDISFSESLIGKVYIQYFEKENKTLIFGITDKAILDTFIQIGK